ncbi:hypothetical protein GJAV_G00226320 [Gymnothorax javanicus]|nr:hypothetical protein GJAV_G00226320 [Gymnothorax javanicus]
MSVSTRNPPQRRKSLGSVSPKRLYRNLSVRLRGGDSNKVCELEPPIRCCRETPCGFKTLWEALESEDTLAVQCLLSKDRVASGGGEKRERRERERELEREANRMSEQGLVPLDVAALTNNSPLLHVLTRAGAKHNPHVSRPSEWQLKLDSLVALAGQRLEVLTEEMLEKMEAGSQGLADAQRQLRLWTHRQLLYRRMRENFQVTVLPGMPSSVSLSVSSDSSLTVSFREPENGGPGLITRHRVEWSRSPRFKPLCGSALVLDSKSLTYSIMDLQPGVPYFVRVCAYTVKGWGPYQRSSPASAAPSSWRECVGVKVRSDQPLVGVQQLLEQIREPHYRGYCTESSWQLGSSKRLSMSRGLKQLFHSATKFVRLLQRGVYLATVFYHKENILVTADDQIPMVEIQSCSTSVAQDFLWFAKLSCAWQEVPWLQQALCSSLSSSSSLLQNRLCILRAITQLQSSLGTVDLGQVYYEPLKDQHGNVLLVTLRECAPPPHPPDPPLHWIALSRLDRIRHRTPLLPEPTAVDTLNDQLKDKLSYHRRGTQRAQPGLYVGVLKLSSSVDQIRVLVSQKVPNVLCHAKVRNNHHVRREEWEWLQSLTVVGQQPVIDSSEIQPVLEEFVIALRAAVTALLTKLSIPLYRAYQYRIYTQELLQFGDQVSMLLLLPPSEDFSASPSPRPSDWAPNPTLSLPLQIFELVHFWAYGRDFLSQYCQAWVRLELDSHLSQQAVREAFDGRELQEAKERLEHVTHLIQGLDRMWRETRWITDVLQYVRIKPTGSMAQLGRLMGGEPPIPETIPEEEEEGMKGPPVLTNPLHPPAPECEGVDPPFESDRVRREDVPAVVHSDLITGEGTNEVAAQMGVGLYNPTNHSAESLSEGHTYVNRPREQGGKDVDGSFEAATNVIGKSALPSAEQETGLRGEGISVPEDVITLGTAGKTCGSGYEEEDDSIAASRKVSGDGGVGLWDPFVGLSSTLPLMLDSPGPTGTRTNGLPARSLVEWVSSSAEQL